MQPLAGHTGWVSSVALRPPGSTLYATRYTTVTVCRAATGECVQTLAGHT
eukprot:SAG22_NODE_21576_length_256_cov_0.598726_2_plen_49_part_01